MTRYATEATRLVETSIVPKLAAAVRQLEEWTGEYASAVRGSSAPSGPTPLLDDEEAELTKLEADATSPDFARRALAAIDYVLGRFGELAVDVGLSEHNQPGPMSSRVATVAWLTMPKRLRSQPVNTQRRILRYCERLDQIIRDTDPIDVDRRPDICHAHERAGDSHVPVDERYCGVQLCRRCGEFRAVHGQYPPKEIVRLHDRGIRPNREQLRRAGIRRGA